MSGSVRTEPQFEGLATAVAHMRLAWRPGSGSACLETFGYRHNTRSCLLPYEICKMNYARGRDFLPIREG